MSTEQTKTEQATEQQTGTCKCGTEVTRDVPPGDSFITSFTLKMPFICDECAERDERERAEIEAREQAAYRRRDHLTRISAKLVRSGLPAMLARRLFADIEAHAHPAALDAARRWVAAFDEYHPGERDTFLRDSMRGSRFHPDPFDGLGDDPGNPAAMAPGWGGADPERRGLVLTGPVGVGKTTILVAAVRELADRDRAIRWLSMPALFTSLAHSFGDDEREKALKTLVEPVPLVLDDLDKTRPTEYAADAVFTAIDSRINEGVPLAVTTNLRISELSTKWPQPYGESIASRLLGYCETVNMQGEDRRAAA